MELQTITFIKAFLNKCHITFDHFSQLNGLIIPRNIFLNLDFYEQIKPDIFILKQHFSSSSMTSLQNTAQTNQTWPLLNLVRQILKALHYRLIPIRKSHGYTTDGKKIFHRFFRIHGENSPEPPFTAE
jgi:hypothetical protein